MKRTFVTRVCLALLLALAVAALAGPAMADEWEYTVSNNEATITKYNGSGSDVTIPGTVNDGSNDYTVKTIGDYAFYGCTKLTSVTIPSSVTTIGNNAFHGCGSLGRVTFADGSKLETIGNNAFEGCTGLTSVTIPSSVTTIGDNAFAALCLTSVTFADGSQLETIGENAFGGCTGLTSVTIPSSVTTIGGYAFQNCGALGRVTFADGSKLETIGNSAFENCGELTSVEIPSSVKTIGGYAFHGCGSLGSVTFADGSQLETIGDYAFQNCVELTSVTIPSSVKTIGEEAFASCKKLTSVTIPNSVQTIGNNAFAASGLTSVEIPDGVKTIEKETFKSCSSLSAVLIPSSVQTIGANAFTDSALGDVCFGGTETDWVTLTQQSPGASIPDSAEVHFNCTSWPMIVPNALPGGKVGTAYSESLRVVGAKGSVEWSVASGLPDGLSIGQTTGIISGTPTAARTFDFTVTATDASAPSSSPIATKDLTIVITTKPAPTPPPDPTPDPTPTPDPDPQPDPTGDPGATLKAVGVPTTGGMAEVRLTGTATFELGTWFGEDRKPATPQSLTVYVDGKARGEVSVTNGRFVLPSIDDDEYELQVEATLPDGSTLKSDKLYVVAGRGTLSAPDLKASPTSAREGDRVTFDLGEWINKREVVVPEGVRWILNGVDVTDLVTGGKLTVEAVDGGDGTMTLIVTATLANGLTGTAMVRVTVTPAPDEGDEEETPGTSGGGCFNVGFGGLAMMACAVVALKRRE